MLKYNICFINIYQLTLWEGRGLKDRKIGVLYKIKRYIKQAVM